MQLLRIAGPVAFIGPSTALPRPPLVASGKLGEAQLQQLSAALAHPEVKRRTPVLLQHHPPPHPPERVKATLSGLVDARAEERVLSDVSRALLLHGHLHRRIHRTLEPRAGHIDAIGATSASLIDDRDNRSAGFNVYDVSDDGAITAMTSCRSMAVSSPAPELQRLEQRLALFSDVFRGLARAVEVRAGEVRATSPRSWRRCTSAPRRRRFDDVTARASRNHLRGRRSKLADVLIPDGCGFKPRVAKLVRPA